MSGWKRGGRSVCGFIQAAHAHGTGIRRAMAIAWAAIDADPGGRPQKGCGGLNLAS